MSNDLHILKSLETKYKISDDKINILKKELYEIQISTKYNDIEINKLKTNLNTTLTREININKSLYNQINEIKTNSTSPIVSEHATLRYLQRVKGIDLDKIYKEIITDKIKTQIMTVRNCKIPVNNYILIVKNGVVVTIESK